MNDHDKTTLGNDKGYINEEPKLKVVFTQGLPASGKSTWAKEFVLKNPDKWVRVCRDDLRNMRGKYLLNSQEDLITEWENSCIYEAIERNLSVIVDATNLNPKFLEEKLKYLRSYFPKIETEIKKFDTPVEECIRRDNLRENKVGEKVIRDMASRYFKKSEVVKMEQDINLPKAIICDLDGTLALLNGRNPYDASTCLNDHFNLPVLYILRMAQSNYYNILFVSGREDKYEHQTRNWLCGSGLKYNQLFGTWSTKYDLFMRKSGDNRDDRIIKREIFDEHIRDKYYIEFVLDDRNKVVQMWRELGLTCLQVADGNF